MFPVAKVTVMDCKQNGELPPEPPPARNGKQRKFSSNQHTRKSWVRMFVGGYGVWSISRAHSIPSTVIEQELREHLIKAGALEQKRAA